MLDWLRRVAGKRERARLERDARKARDAELMPRRKGELHPPPAAPDQLEELARLVGEHEPRRGVNMVPKNRRGRRQGRP